MTTTTKLSRDAAAVTVMDGGSGYWRMARSHGGHLDYELTDTFPCREELRTGVAHQHLINPDIPDTDLDGNIDTCSVRDALPGVLSYSAGVRFGKGVRHNRGIERNWIAIVSQVDNLTFATVASLSVTLAAAGLVGEVLPWSNVVPSENPYPGIFQGGGIGFIIYDAASRPPICTHLSDEW